MNRYLRSLAVLALAAPGLLGMLLPFDVSRASSALQTPSSLPSDSVYQLDASLVDQSGRRFDWCDLRGRPRVVSLFYTSCPFVCPLLVETGKGIERALTTQERDRLGIVMISLDPRHDTPTALAALATRRGLDVTRWTLAQPAATDLPALAGVLGTGYRVRADGVVDHTAMWVLLDANGRVLARSERVGSVPDPHFIKAVRAALAPNATGSGH